MFLYELALELNKKSLDLVELGRTLGMTDLGPSVTLTPDQVAAFRTAVLGVPTPALLHGTDVAAPGGGAPGGAPVAIPGAPGGRSDRTKAMTGRYAIVGVVTVAAIALLGFMITHSGPNKVRADQTAAADGAAAASASGGGASLGTGADGADSASAPVTAREVAASLPEPEALDVLLDVHRPANLTWSINDETVIDAADANGQDLGGTCTSDPKPTGAAARSFVLTDPAGGIHGQAAIGLRTFATTDDAQAWLDAHAGSAFEACVRADSRSTLAIESGGVVTDDQLTEVPPVADGKALGYVASYRTSSGPCVDYEEHYVNVVGTVAVSAMFSTCRVPFDPGVEQTVIAKVLASRRT